MGTLYPVALGGFAGLERYGPPGRRKNCRLGLAGAETAGYNHASLGLVAQLVEQRIENPCVGGSIPPRATKNSAVLTKTPTFAVGVFVFRFYFIEPAKPSLPSCPAARLWRDEDKVGVCPQN
jgi:hypothetical protein